MTLSSMVVSRDWQEVSVLECILGSLHIGVDVESEPERARAKLAKLKIDALIVDCDLTGSSHFLRGLQRQQSSVPLIIVSGSNGRKKLNTTGAAFVFHKPISVEEAVHTLSAARNLIMDGRLRYHRQVLDLPVSLMCNGHPDVQAHLVNLSQGGIGICVQHPLPVTGLIRVSLVLPGCERLMKFKGEVAWTDQLGHAGIRLVEIGKRARKDLQLWLEKQYFVSH